jgi:hypothetical protein
MFPVVATPKVHILTLFLSSKTKTEIRGRGRPCKLAHAQASAAASLPNKNGRRHSAAGPPMLHSTPLAADSGAALHVSNIIATRRKKTRAVCGVCLQEDSIHDGWMHRCLSCDVCVHAHCAHALGLACEENQFKCGSCSLPEVAASCSCLICMRKASTRTVCVGVPVACGAAGVFLVHAPCLILSRIHRLAPPASLPMRSPAAIFLRPAADPASGGARCCICRTEGGEMQQCMHATCGKLVHASCAADSKLVWFATARDYSARSDGSCKIFTACCIQHVKQDQVFCTCLRPYDTQGSTMVQCDDCRAWFHCDCLGIDDEEDDLNELQSKQFRCAECAAKLSLALPLHPPIFMCDVRRQWSHSKMLLPPRLNAPSLHSELPLSSQHEAVSAIAADALLLILQTSKTTSISDLRSATCVACLLPLDLYDVTAKSLFSTISRRLCSACRCARQSLLYLCVPAPSSTICLEYPMHPKAHAVVEQAAAALAASATVANIQHWQKW